MELAHISAAIPNTGMTSPSRHRVFDRFHHFGYVAIIAPVFMWS